MIKKKWLIPPLFLAKIDIQKYYQNQPKSNGVYSRDNLPKKIKDEEYLVNLDEYTDIRTHSIV